MKFFLKLMLAVEIILFLSTSNLYATANNHYVSGGEGVKAASCPPPGFYYRMYNLYYTADELMDDNGSELPIDFDVNVFAVVNRFIWITEKKILRADFFMDAVLPIVSTDIEIGAMGLDQDKFGIADLLIEPFGLAWHGSRYDAVVALGVWLPIGEYDSDNLASPGKGFTTFMATFGGTLYLDASRTWSASVLGRYEIHTDKEEADLTPGDDFHFEWGIGKSFANVWSAGVAGYCQWQVTDDSGADAVNPGTHDKVFGIGPEIDVFVPSIKSFFNLRGVWEFGAEDRTEGNVIALTFTKIF